MDANDLLAKAEEERARAIHKGTCEYAGMIGEIADIMHHDNVATDRSRLDDIECVLAVAGYELRTAEEIDADYEDEAADMALELRREQEYDDADREE